MNREKDTDVAASRGSVNAKPIPWEKNGRDDDDLWSGDMAFGVYYCICPARKRYEVTRAIMGSEGGQTIIATSSTLDKAKAEAQEDFDAELTKYLALTVNTSTPGNELEYNGLAATRDLERRIQKLEWYVSTLIEEKKVV